MRTFILIIMVLFILFVLISDCQGVYQRIGDIELMSTSSLQVEVVDNIAYTLEYQWFNIYDVSDPSNPISLSNTYFNSELSFMQIRDNYAFISGGSAKFIVLDISDNTSPTIIDEISFYGNMYYCYIKRFCLDGNYAYLDYYDYSSYDKKLLVVDISDLNNCTLINEMDTNLTTNCMFINEEFLYLFGFGSYLGCVFDISECANPILLTTYSDLSMVHAEVISNMVYCINADDFKVYDFSDPLNIVERVHFENDHPLYYVTILDNKAYLACGGRGIKILDITDIEQITEIGVYDTQINASNGARQLSLIDENTVIIAEWSDDVFIILDVSDPEPPTAMVTRYHYPCRERNIDINDNLLVFFDYDCINFWDVTDFNDPISLYTYSLGYPIWCENVYVTDDHVFITFLQDTDYKLFSFETSDINNIYLEGSCNISTRHSDMGVYDNYLYLPSYHFGLEIYDFSSGLDPVFVAIYPNFYGTKIEIVESFAFMPLIDELALLDISNPNSVTQVTSWPMTHSIIDLHVEDDILFIKHFDNNTIAIYDITDVLNPVYINEIQLNPTSQLARNFFIFDHKIYISDLSLNEIVIYDVTIPANPVFDSSIRWNLKTWDMVAKDNYLFIGNHYFGSTLFDTTQFTEINIDMISADKLELINFPNPFNPSTSISYQLAHEAKTEITIFNIKGQKVKELVDERQIAGQHSVVWNGTDDFGKKVSSGIYFYKLDINGKIKAVKKCLLLK
ncbi:MAG: T9SS type A sorting domain-containing protein [Bacteroidales bacterium]|nr:T9SS type A sorting domain-containing protein [Bacteroidales bacterium]